MLSKILRGASAPAAQPFAWPAAAGTGSPPALSDRAPGDAARRISELEEQVDRRVREARQGGYNEGQAAGRAQAAAELQPVLERLARTIQEIAGLRPRLMREAQQDLVELSLGIARRILHRELAVDSGAIAGLVGVALDKLAGQEICRVRVHPELEAGVRQALAQAGRGGLPLVPDGTLERGAVLLETGRGKLDASIDTQLAEIGRGLADRMADN